MVEVHEQNQQVVTMTISDLIYAQVKDLGKRMDRIENRMDKLDERMDKLDARMDKLNARMDKLNARMDKQDEKIDKLADKIDSLHRDIITSNNHGNIMTASLIGIALSAIYAAFFK